MIVTKANFEGALAELCLQSEIGFDTETTCLPFWRSEFFEKEGVTPRVFSMQFATSKTSFYFDFNHSHDALTNDHFDIINKFLTSDESIKWYIQNAPFDLNHCANHNVFFAGKVHCTKAIARLIDNLEPSLKLDDLGLKYLGAKKEDVMTPMKERGHITKIKKWGYNDKFEEVYHFDRLKLQELAQYGEKDSNLCFRLGQFQVAQIKQIDETILASSPKKLSNVYENECKLTKIIAEMAYTGIKIDVEYCKEAYEHEVKAYKKYEEKFKEMAGSAFDGNAANILSPRSLKSIFDQLEIPYTFTEKGNACFDTDALESSSAEISKVILKYRYHHKRAHTYFENFVWLADTDNVLHADAQQAGTGFGRMSYWTPNLQNIPKRSESEESEYFVRKCFVPRPGFFFVDIDFKGAEFYMMIDYAKEMKVVDQLKNGVDPHKALGDEMSLSRDAAKTMQFRILYGAGQAAIGKALGYEGEEATRIGKQKKNEYFSKMPGVADLISRVTSVAKMRGYIINWLGRILKYDHTTAYKATNGLIQGGVGDMTKVAMVNLYEKLLYSINTRMLLQVHDAILFEMQDDELDKLEEIKKSMCDAYPASVLPMQVDAKFSRKTWHDLQEKLV